MELLLHWLPGSGRSCVQAYASLCTCCATNTHSTGYQVSFILETGITGLQGNCTVNYTEQVTIYNNLNINKKTGESPGEHEEI